jgi:hypothetical protein
VDSTSSAVRSQSAHVAVSVRDRGPAIALACGAILIMIFAALIAVHVTVFALDESLIQQSALHYSSNLPTSLFHDIDARATDRLYSLILSIAYRLTGGPAAVRVDHALSVAMFVSAAVPIYLMARTVLGARWPAVAAALLSVAAPWLTLTSALFTENLAYPLFWWLLLAVCAAVWQPSPRRDLLVLVVMGLLVGTRVQFAAVFPGYLLCLLAACVSRTGPQDGRRRLRGVLAVVGRGFPFTSLVLVIAIAALLYARTSGEWHAHVVRLFGSYTNVILRNGPPPNIPEGLLVEVIALSLGVGLLPALVSVPWYLRRLTRPALERPWVYLAASGAVMLVFLILTVYSQGGYLGRLTEERYFFYVIPAFWIGTFAALREGELAVPVVLVWTAALAILFAAIGFLPVLTEETAFLAPVEAIVPRVLGQTALVILTVLAGLVTCLIWARWPRVRVWWTIGLGALVQLALAGYAFAAIDGMVPGVQGRTSGSIAALDWVDAHAGGQTVTWLENLSTVQPPAIDLPAAGLAVDQVHVTLFWNSQLRNTAHVPAADSSPFEFPLTGLPTSGALSVDPADGSLLPSAAAAGIQEVVGESASPFLQLAGGTLAQSPDRFLALTRLHKPARATWMTTGLGPDGEVAAGEPVRLRAWAPEGVSTRPVALTVAMAFTAPPSTAGQAEPPTAMTVRVGHALRRITLRAGAAPTVIDVRSCLSPGSDSVTGSIESKRPVARGVAGVLQAASVSESPEPGRGCPTG